MALRASLFSAMKNEGPFILEWVAYHRLIGFQKIFVFTNDCDDGSSVLLNSLAEIGWLEHHDNTSTDGSAPQKRAASQVFKLPQFQNSELAIWLDADEFLNIHTGAGLLADLEHKLGNASGICMNWRIFGSNGLRDWCGGLVTESFPRASRKGFNLNRQMKTLFRPGPDIASLYLHKPEVSARFTENGGFFVNAANQRLPDDYYHAKRNHGDPIHELPPELVSHSLAQINHYAVRSFDSYVVKRHRGNGWKSAQETAKENRYRYRLSFWDKHNRNEAEDLSIQRHLHGLTGLIAEACSNPAVRQAQADCLVAYLAKVEMLSGEIAELSEKLNRGLGDD